MTISFDDGSVALNQELGKIPLDVNCICASSQSVVKWMCFISIDVHLLKHWESDAILLDESLNLLMSTWFLSTELVAWEREDLKALVRVVFVHLN